MINFHKKVFTNISVFGSSARSEQDKYSDLDILVVVEDGCGKQNENYIIDIIGSAFQKKPSISWYGEGKIQNFFETGDLFAWHLHLESQPVRGFDHISNKFGKPADYNDAYSTIVELSLIYNEISNAVKFTPQNIKYELGICYVCFRNIAMAASWHVCAKPDFNRYSPYAINFPRFPIPPQIYELLWMCRISGQRGLPPPDITSIDFAQLFEQGREWIEQIQEVIRNATKQSID